MAFPTSAHLRLEVQDTPVGLANMVPNPNGDLGGWGWVTPVSSSQVLRGGTAPNWNLQLKTTAGDAFSIYTEPMPLAPGQWVRCLFAFLYRTLSHYSSYEFQFLDAGQNLISAAGTNLDAGSSAHTAGIAASQAPALTAFVRVRFFWAAPGGTFSIGVNKVTVAQAATSAELAAMPTYIAPAGYTDVLGPTSDIKLERDELNVSLLEAIIRDAALDPATSALLRPGKGVQLTTLVGSTWTTLYTGRLPTTGATYDLLQAKPAKRTTIALTATDAATQLASSTRPDGVATIAQLPHVLEGCGIPWNVNGSVNQTVGLWNVPIVSVNPSATALDQVAITRDSAHGYAWVDRAGVLQAWDATSLGATSVGTLTESDYSNLDVAFDLERCVNEVTIKLLRTNIATGETVEVSYGPYRDQASINEWGRRAADFTVHGLTETEATMRAFASEVFAANATPEVRINSVTLPIRSPSDLTAAKALADLYSLVRVTNTAKALDQTARVNKISHTITPDGWVVVLGFSRQGSVAPPQVTPPLQNPGIPPAQLALTMQSGVRTSGTLVAGVVKTVSVAFPVPFVTVPRVSCTVDTATPDVHTASKQNVTVLGFDIKVRRNAGTAALDVDWIATTA